LWPNKGENDSRPIQGQSYVSLSPVAPHAPFVPHSALGELRTG
jgi:cholesterol oxidase